jgi:hypothetical protein
MSADPDDHPTVVHATVRLLSEQIALQIRRAAAAVARSPEITAEQALLDVADSIERTAAQFIARSRQ